MGEIPMPASREIFVTHHAPDFARKYDLQPLFQELKKSGVDSHRFDMRWNRIQPKSTKINDAYLARATDIAKSAEKAGLSPIVILSSPPKWARELYKKDPETFFAHFRAYAEAVKASFEQQGMTPKRIQILNEINNSAFTPPELVKDLPRFCGIAKEVFGPETKLSATIFATGLTLRPDDQPMKTALKLFGKLPFVDTLKFIDDNQASLRAFDTLSVDYYPGLYHHSNTMVDLVQPKNLPRTLRGMKEWSEKVKSEFKKEFSDLSYLERVLTKLVPMGKELEIGEFGFPTIKGTQKLPKYEHDRLQHYAYSEFVHAIRPILDTFPMVRRIGFYQMLDEKPTEFLVFNFGMYDKKGKPKAIVEKLPGLIDHLRATKTAPATASSTP